MELYPLLAALPRDRSNYGLIHNDLHQMNFFYNPAAAGVNCLTIIDFDVCAYNWFFSDIAIAAYHAAANGSQTSLAERQVLTDIFLNPFLQGYRLENTLDESWLEHLPLFMKYREILLYIALINSWPEEERLEPSNKRWLAEKRIRTLKNEPII
jgi:Ser/Thr protein kinase RdoA (MazF antagonist)